MTIMQLISRIDVVSSLTANRIKDTSSGYIISRHESLSTLKYPWKHRLVRSSITNHGQWLEKCFRLDMDVWPDHTKDLVKVIFQMIIENGISSGVWSWRLFHVPPFTVCWQALGALGMTSHSLDLLLLGVKNCTGVWIQPNLKWCTDRAPAACGDIKAAAVRKRWCLSNALIADPRCWREISTTFWQLYNLGARTACISHLCFGSLKEHKRHNEKHLCIFVGQVNLKYHLWQ